MKKRTTFLIAVIFLFSCSGSHTGKKLNNDWTKMNLKGKVKTIIERAFGNERTYTFNTDGNLTELFNGTATAEVSMEKMVFKFDEKGLTTECIVYNPNGSLQGRALYKYDSDGYRTEEAGYSYDPQNKEKYQGKKIFTYDAEMNMIREDTYKPDNSPGETTTYNYDDNGYLIEEKNGNHIIKYKNDDKGNPIEVTLEGTERCLYTYDKNNNWIRKVNDTGGNEGTGVIEREISYY